MRLWVQFPIWLSAGTNPFDILLGLAFSIGYPLNLRIRFLVLCLQSSRKMIMKSKSSSFLLMLSHSTSIPFKIPRMEYRTTWRESDLIPLRTMRLHLKNLVLCNAITFFPPDRWPKIRSWSFGGLPFSLKPNWKSYARVLFPSFVRGLICTGISRF